MGITKQSIRERQIAVIEHYLAHLREICQIYSQGGEAAQEALRRFDLDWQQLKAQQQNAARLAAHDLTAVPLVIAFAQTAAPLLVQMNVEDAILWLTDALPYLGDSAAEIRYDIRMSLYGLYKLRRQADAMRATLDDIERLANQLDDLQRQIRAACLNAEYYETLYQYDVQLTWAEHALTYALRLEDPVLVAEAQYQVGFAHLRLYHSAEARHLLHQSLSLFQSLGRQTDEVKVLSALALNAYYAMAFDEAMHFGKQALSLARTIGFLTREVQMLSNLGLFCQGAGDLQAALEYGRKAWLMATDKGLVNTLWTTLGSMVMTLGTLGLADELTQYIDYLSYSMPPSPYMEDVIRSEQAKLAYEYENWETSIRLAAAYVLNEQAEEDMELRYSFLMCWGLSQVVQQHWDESVEPLTWCQDLQGLIPDNPQMMSGYLACLSLVEVNRGHTEEAQSLLNHFFDLNAETHFTRLVWAGECLCAAYQAAVQLHDARSAVIQQAISSSLATFLSKLTDEQLRTSYLNLYTPRQMQAIAGV